MSDVENEESTEGRGGSIRAKNRQRILYAAEQEFAKYGFKGTSVQAIADSVELPKANILYYFKSKTGLYKALLTDILEMWNQGFSIDANQQAPDEVIRRYIIEKMRYSRTHPMRSKIFAMEIIQGAPIIRDAIEQPMVVWSKSKVDVIQTWIDEGLITKINPLYLLFLIWGTTQFYADFDSEIELINGRSLDDEEFIEAGDFTVNIVLKGLGLR
ncbi:TetR family transcriptional regulator C-terminal domain-containing protein [Vibrio sp. DW001]|uniref:TetR family transcriptional regulator C-terminal domain-containing protein n=1 Tax=Vibrio sp. DW001 TaxID=2912315 RepID=UPI0023B00A53|nr:TetR family transcriptional regulator C-terminal domain-containing protein [Vibrio sp. DW001]WED25318.1 TetR family transcriptional regulator C-terminal domain-containing protein [Vibrio sp. DW001]